MVHQPRKMSVLADALSRSKKVELDLVLSSVEQGGQIDEILA